MGVQSFGASRAAGGRDEELTEPQTELVLLPQMMLPPVQLPIVLVLDQAALAEVQQRIQDMVTDAVRQGVHAALDGSVDEFTVTGDQGDSYVVNCDAPAAPAPSQVADLTR